MKKKFWGFQSYWKWYGLAITLLVTIINADNYAPHFRNYHNLRNKKSSPTSDTDISQSVLANISMEEHTFGSQLERVPPIPNTTEYHVERTTEKYCKYFLDNIIELISAIISSLYRMIQ